MGGKTCFFMIPETTNPYPTITNRNYNPLIQLFNYSTKPSYSFVNTLLIENKIVHTIQSIASSPGIGKAIIERPLAPNFHDSETQSRIEDNSFSDKPPASETLRSAQSSDSS